MADVQYLNYGDLQIELLALLNNLANNVQSYVESQSWSKSRKEKFMSAYQDIMNRGLLGASNTSGLWVLNVRGDDFGFDNMDRKSREMYQEAAYFIQQQMSSLPTKASLEEDEEKKKKELPLFDNKYFTTNFLNQLSKDWFGGMPFNTQSDWNSLDARGENGRRGRKVRADRLAQSLENYVNSLDETKLNFEGSPFNDLNDFRTRVNEAITALKTDSPDDDLDALSRIGLRASDYFNDGSGDSSGKIINGQELTYGLLEEYLAEQKAEQESELKLKLQQLRLEFENNRLYFQTHTSKLFGKDLNYLANKYLTELLLIPVLLEYVQRGLSNLNGEELSELIGGFKYGAKDQITDDELKAFKAYSPIFKNSTKNLFRKLKGVEGAFFYIPTGKVYTYGGKGSLNLLATTTSTNTDFLKGYSDEARKLLERTAAKDRKFLSSFRDFDSYANRGLQGTLEGAKDLYVDSLRATALVADAGSLIASFIPGVGTAVSGALGIGGLISETMADLFDKGVSWEEFTNNLLSNASFAAIGLLPGGKLGKFGQKVWKYSVSIGGIVFSTVAGKQMLEDPNFRNSWNKLVDGKWTDINGSDVQNYVKFLGIAAGITSGTRHVASSIRYGRLQGSTPVSHTIETTKGKATVTPEQLNKIHKIAREKGNKDANDYLQSIKNNKGETPYAGHEIIENFTPGKIRNSKYNPYRTEIKPVSTEYGRTPAQTRKVELLRLRSEAIHNGKGWARRLPTSIRRFPTSYDLFLGNTTYLDLFRGNFFKSTNKNLNTPKHNTSNLGLEHKLLISKKLEQKLLPYLGNVNLKEHIGIRPLNYSIRLNQKEVNALLDDYGISGLSNVHFGARSKRPITNQHTGTYDVNKPLKDGTYNLNSNGTNITFTKLNGKVTISFNGIKKEFKNLGELENLVSARLYLARLLSTEAKNDISKTAEILRNLKKQGVFKQGGRIDKQKIQKYKEFINK